MGNQRITNLVTEEVLVRTLGKQLEQRSVYDREKRNTEIERKNGRGESTRL